VIKGIYPVTRYTAGLPGITSGARRLMIIEVKLFVEGCDGIPFGKKETNSARIDIPRGTSIREVMMSLGVPVDERNLCFVNGAHKEIDYVLNENDVLLITPPLAGG
jgi:hypothetical protein